MSFTVIECAQRTPEWYAARAGRLTSSDANDMLATIKSGGYGAGRKNLVAKFLLERVTGKSQESGFQSNSMLQGVQREADALAQYEALTPRFVQTAGFLRHDTLMAGASLDAYVGDFEGIVEAKCPEPATHLEYLTTGKVPLKYERQILHQLFITGAQWCDWLSFNPDFPEPLHVKVVRIQRNEEAIAQYGKDVEVFLAEVDRAVESVRTMLSLSDQLKASVA